MSHIQKRFCGLLTVLFAVICLSGLSAGWSIYAEEAHVHNYVAVETYEASCTAKGGILYKCTECQDTYINYKTDMLPHTWETVSQTAPTCTQSGSLTRRCKVCGTEETTVNGSATGHTYTQSSVKAPTCSEQGYTYRVCKDCGFTEIDEASYTEKIDHTYEMQILTEPTCTLEGCSEYTCTVCGYSYRETIATVDHDWLEEITSPTCTEGGYTTFTCRFCTLTKREAFTDPLGHDMTYTVTEATCTEDGLKLGVCKHCNYTETEKLSALGHDFGAWIADREASETLVGLEHRECLLCGLTESQLIPYEAPIVSPRYSPAVLLCIGFVLLIVVGGMVLLLLLLLEHAGRKNTRKHALLTAVDKALAEEKESPQY